MSDKKLQKELFQKLTDNESIIFKVCNIYCDNKSDKEDLAQEIIYQLLKSFHSFKNEYKFTTWMYRVALNVAISFYRKNKTSRVITFREHQEDLTDHDRYPLDLEKDLDTLEQFINQLKDLDKAIMILYLESKSYKEIAEIIGITETNVATKISRIKDMLKQKFSKLNQ
jgi:RNA polymerase sigma factor (sigma-70 family)